MTYQVAQSHNSAGSLATITPQPAMPEALQYPELLFAGDGSASPQGYLFGEMVWNGAITATERASILSQFGISDAVPSKNVTVRVRQNDGTFANFNATAVLVGAGSRPLGGFYRDLRIRLNRLEAL